MSLKENYMITDPIGRGSMGSISKAIQKSLDRYVAVKLINPHLSDDPHHIRRLEREAKSAARLKHMNVMEIIDFGREDSQYYIVVEYIDGPSLAQILQRVPMLPLEVVIATVMQTLNGLEHAHNKGIIHRDIKPENIMFTRSGIAKITDFGVAHITRQPSITQADMNIIGTPHYMSPEQADGKEIDNRSDLFSVGVMLYQLLTNTLPFDGDNIAVVLNKIISKPFVPVQKRNPDVSDELARILEKALHKDVTRRYFDATEFMHALETFAFRSGTPYNHRVTKSFLETELDLDEQPPELERPAYPSSFIGKSRPSVAILPLTGCFGCQVNLLDLHEDIVEFAQLIDIRFTYLMDIKKIPKVDIGLVEGCVANTENEDRLKKLRDACESLVALGTCACFGGIPGLRNLHSVDDLISRAYLQSESTVKIGTIPDSPDLPPLIPHVRPLSEVVKVDISIPGCPPPPGVVLDTFRKITKGENPVVSSHALCYDCPRTRKEMLNPKREFIADAIRPIMELEVIDPGICFLEQGVLCMGITTRSGCGARCVGSNIPCQGCMGPAPHVRETGAKWINALGSLLPGGSLRFRHDLVGIGYCYTLPCSMMPGLRDQNRDKI
jgi:serine/threonine protein kinase